MLATPGTAVAARLWSLSRRARNRTIRPSARRSPAAWLRGRLLAQLLAVMVPALVGAGVCLGALLGQWVPILYVSFATVVVLGTAYVWLRSDRRWSLSNLERGIDAEYRVGQVIDYALVPRNCAVAHGVVGIGVDGDIDHLVATPGALWVIETKARAVPQDLFPAVLERIAANVHAVEDWASGVPVCGCLVLLEPFRGRRDYEADDGTPVLVHDEKSLRDALRADTQDEGAVGAELARRVWELGRITA